MPSIPPTKQCAKCGETFPATAEYWHKLKRGKYGLRSQCKNCGNESSRKWRKANSEKLREYNRQYQKAHHKELCKWKSEYRKTNPDKIRNYQQQWQRDNPDKRRATEQKRRARKANTGGSYTAVELREQYKRQKGHCYWCGEKLKGKYEADHVIPLSKGGSNYISNIVCACMTCNRSKHDKLPHEWDGTNRLL